jgi:LmbE family N-acetylglucosaminyl deacetylase
MNLLLAPHNDDETLWASYLILRHNPHVVICLKSVRMHQKDYPGGPVTADREQETACAMRLLNAEWTQWPVPDDTPDWKELADLMRGLKNTGEVEQVFAPAFEEGGHGHHNRVAVLARAVFGSESVTHYLTYTGEGRSRWGTKVEPDGGWIDLKREALMCYQSQIEHPATQAWFLGDECEYVA